MRKPFAILTIAALAAFAAVAQLIPINTGTIAGDGTGDPLRTAGMKMNTNFINLFSVQQPRLILWGDSQSTINSGSWLMYVRSNSIWANRAPIISLAWPGQPFATLMANRTNQTTQYISPISNLTYLLSYCSVRNTDTNVAMTNFLNLWSWANQNGVRVIQFGFQQSSDAAINDFLRTNSSLYYKYVEATNFTTSDGVHADAAGSVTIANKFLSIATNFIPIVNQPIRGVGQSVFTAGESNDSTAIRVHGQIVSDYAPAFFPYPAFVDRGYWFHHRGADNHVGIWMSNETVNASEDLVIGTAGLPSAIVEEEGPFGFHRSTRHYGTGNARTTDKQYLRISYETTHFGIKYLAEGAAAWLPIKIDGGANSFIWVERATGAGVGINTNAPAATLHVSGTGIFQDTLESGPSKVFVTGSSAVANQEYLRTGALGTNFIDVRTIGAGTGLFRDLSFTSGGAIVALSARTGGVGINTTNPTSTLTVNGTISAAGTITIAQGSSLQTASRGGLTGSADGFIQFYANGFTRPVGLKSQVNGLEIRVNDDSGYAALTASNVTATALLITTPNGSGAIAVAASGTIPTTNSLVRTSPAGAVASVVLQAGTVDGQQVTVVNEATAANTITFAVAGTSNVADGTSSVIAGLNAREFVWVASPARWYPKK